MIPRSRYTFERSHRAVYITDLDCGQRSVTNDAEAVVRDLVDRGVDVDRVVVLYRDSTGAWDQMLTRGGEFTGFRVLRANDRREAFRLASDDRA